MCVTADLQVLGSFGDGDVGVVSTQLQQRLSVDTNGLCATLREVLGDKVYESFARAGEAMTIAAMANYALANIERARTR